MKSCKNLFQFIILAMLVFMKSPAGSQEVYEIKNRYPAGIHFGIMYGGLAVKDQNISSEKYTGKFLQYVFGWARYHEKYAYRLNFIYGFSDQIKNYKSSAEITQVSLDQGFLYPLKQIQFFKKDLYFFMGPSTGFIYYFNKPKIAVAGFDYSQSFAAMLSLGLSTEAFYTLCRKLQLESSLNLSVLSFSFRQVDSEENDESPAKLLTLFKGLNGNFDLGARYFILKNLSIKAGYKFQLINISVWEPLTTAEDNIKVGLTFRF